MIDSHIHLDQYMASDIEAMNLSESLQVITVSMDLVSAKRNLELKSKYVHIAAGFHPEQHIRPVDLFIEWIHKHKSDIVAIGEVGLPQYLERSGQVANKQDYIILLERFIRLASELELPVILHAVYDDARIALTLLRKHHIKRAHFHWFKATDEVVRAVIDAGYMMSVTVDILHNDKTRRVVQLAPLNQLMVETDGPWCHNMFSTTDIKTQLSVILDEIATIKGIDRKIVEETITNNTKHFYLRN